MKMTTIQYYWVAVRIDGQRTRITGTLDDIAALQRRYPSAKISTPTLLGVRSEHNPHCIARPIGWDAV